MNFPENGEVIGPNIAADGNVDMERRRMLKTLLLTPLLSSSLFAAMNGCGGSAGAEGQSPAPDPYLGNGFFLYTAET
jgi:hypothetical protein